MPALPKPELPDIGGLIRNKIKLKENLVKSKLALAKGIVDSKVSLVSSKLSALTGLLAGLGKHTNSYNAPKPSYGPPSQPSYKPSYGPPSYY